MTQYIPYRVSLTKNQMKKLMQAYQNRCQITLRLQHKNLTGLNELMLTKTQIKRIEKSKKMNKGVNINISKYQINKIFKEGGNLWSSASKLLPMALPLAKKAAAPLLTGALSGLASLGIDKLFGSNQKGDFLFLTQK